MMTHEKGRQKPMKMTRWAKCSKRWAFCNGIYVRTLCKS